MIPGPGARRSPGGGLRRVWRVAWLVLALAAGCARSPKPLPPPVPLGDSHVASILRELRRETGSVRRYQGFVRARGRGPEGGFDARLVVIFERDSRLRVELLGAFGSTRWSAVVAGEGITVVFPGPEQYVREEDVEEVVGRLLGVRLGAAEVMAILSGAGIVFEPGEHARGYRRGALAFVELQGGRRLELDDAGQLLRARTPRYVVSYPTSWKRERRQIPDRIELANDAVRTTLTVEEVDVNVALDPGAFELDVPEGAERLRPAEVEGEAVFVVTGRAPSHR